MTLTIAQPSGSKVGQRAWISSKSDTPIVGLYVGQHDYDGTLGKASLERIFEDLQTFLSNESRMRVVEVGFQQLANEWKRDTVYLSSTDAIVMHPAYQRIIGMGQGVISLILQDLEEAPAHWFHALRAITGESPVRPEDRGNIDAMRRAWLDWGASYLTIRRPTWRTPLDGQTPPGLHPS